jgi:hypothetical protein
VCRYRRKPAADHKVMNALARATPAVSGLRHDGSFGGRWLALTDHRAKTLIRLKADQLTLLAALCLCGRALALAFKPTGIQALGP